MLILAPARVGNWEESNAAIAVVRLSGPRRERDIAREEQLQPTRRRRPIDESQGRDPQPADAPRPVL